MLPGKRNSIGAIYVLQGPPPAGTPFVGGIAVSRDGAIYVSQAFAPPFSPANLFASGEQGAWFDPSDLSTMFQDSAGTTPVTADGQPVGLIRDKSGRNNHASQATAAARPLYKTDGTSHWLKFDGVDDTLKTGNIDLSSHPDMTVWASLKHEAISAAGSHIALAFGPQVYSDNGTFALFSGGTNERQDLLLRGTQTTSLVSSYNNNGKNIVRYAFDISKATRAEEMVIVENSGAFSVWSGGDAANAGTGSFGNYAFSIGKNPSGSYPWQGLCFGLILRAGATDSATAIDTDGWLLDKTGGMAGMAIGDSTTSFYSGLKSVFTGFTSGQARELLLAVPGNTIAQQATAFANYPFKDQVAWVGIQVGINDLNYTEAASLALGRIQSLVNQVRAGIPASAKIMVCGMTPCKAKLISEYGATNGAIAYQKWLDMNAGISGGGATPITGADVVATNHVAALNDGSGNLAVAYDYGDGVHPNNAGRQIISDSWVAALQSIGVTP